MAASIPPLNCDPPLSYKQRKAASRKERRKRKRQAIARTRECAEQSGDVEPSEEVAEEDDEDASIFDEERQRLHEEWLERERLAQEEFRLRSEREAAARKRREDDERKIKEEWEAQQKREEEEKEQKQQQKRDREEAFQKMLDEAENQLANNGGPWMNPEAPVTEKSENYGTERDVANCPFFLKTGSCRFGDRCSRKHLYPSSSPTLLIRAMFITYGMEQSRRDDYDGDASLEHSEEELHESFTEFYHDVLPEFKTVGKVVQFKVSCNYESHLRGNVYVQFDTEEQCREAFIKFNGRWYAGKQLHCEICPVTRWKNAICGLFDRNRCPKGKHCNFLHVFRNPGNEFWEADRDLHISPDRSIKGSHSERYSERRGDRSRRSHRSRSPPRSERSYGRREEDRRSERSRDRRTSQSQRDDSRRSFGSAHYDRSRDSYKGRSREKSRSRSRDRKRSRDRDRNPKSRSKSGEKYRNGDAERNKRSREKSGHRSPGNDDETRSVPDEDSKKRRHHKHSKKNNKKSKKKKKQHKKRSCSPEAVTSSRESEDETLDKRSEKSPSGEKAELLQNNDDLSASPSVDDAKKNSTTQVDEPAQSSS
ncbi:U2 small nuclear ribonucleoprotein auxiliary factor 35 kDa subunit-related protein 2-like [Festucalex cinctus]